MSSEQWEAVDAYIEETIIGHDPALEQALAASAQAGLPEIAVTPAQGRMLQLLVRIQRARFILEVGTLGGYSTIWLARGLPPGGRIVTLELREAYAEVAAANLRRAGVEDRAELRVGPAAESLRELREEWRGPFDLIFIDADKPSTPVYFEHALELAAPAGVILVDNVVRRGELADPESADEGAQGMRRTHELIATATAAGRVSATTIQTVGAKGYDGFTLVRMER